MVDLLGVRIWHSWFSCPSGSPRIPFDLARRLDDRNGLCLEVEWTPPTTIPSVRIALDILRRVRRRHKLRAKTVGFDAGYEDNEFLNAPESVLPLKPHLPVRSGTIKAEVAAGEATRRARRHKA